MNTECLINDITLHLHYLKYVFNKSMKDIKTLQGTWKSLKYFNLTV